MRWLRTAPRYLDLTPTQYQNALDWLQHLGVVDEAGLCPHYDAATAAAKVLSLYLEATNPAWLEQIDGLIRNPQDLPIDILGLTEEVAIADSVVLDVSRAVARKFDDQRLKEIGRRGEELLLADLRNRTDQRMVWVSETDDAAGFDIYVGDANNGAEIEVKSTIVKSRVRFYLSRNEYRRMQSSDRWSLQIVVLDDSGIADLFFVDRAWIVNGAPNDVSEQGTWQSARFEVGGEHLRGGLHPRVLEVISGRSTIAGK